MVNDQNNQKKKKTDAWFDKQVCDMRQELRKFSRKIRRQDIENLKFLTKRYRHTCKIKYKEFRAKLLSKLEGISGNNSKEAWSTLRELKGEEDIVSPANIDAGTWYNHYKTLNNMKTIFEATDQRFKGLLKTLYEEKKHIASETLNAEITEEEINNAITGLKMRKASGCDRILNEIIKATRTVMLPVLHKLFNSVLSKGNYPDAWAEGMITSIYKNANPLDPNNYRGITITSNLGKLFNCILNKRLDQFSKETNSGCPEQIAYETGSRTTDHSFVLQTIIHKYLNSKKELFACFVDMRKAFDTVLLSGLLYKLMKMNVTRNYYRTRRSM